MLSRGVGPPQPLQAAPGHLIGNRTQLEVGDAGKLGHLTGRDGTRGGIAAKDAGNLFTGNQATGFADGLVVVDCIAALQDDLLTLHAAIRVDLLHRDFQAAVAFLTQQREIATEGIERAELHVGSGTAGSQQDASRCGRSKGLPVGHHFPPLLQYLCFQVSRAFLPMKLVMGG